MYNTEKVYRSVHYFVTQIMPSGIVVVDGESYGIRMDDPAYEPASASVTIETISDAPLELGSFGSHYPVTITLSGKSRFQRDALKDIVRSALNERQIPIYSDFINFIPSSGATIETYAALGDYYQARNMPNFESDRERFFWNAVVFVTLDILGL